MHYDAFNEKLIILSGDLNQYDALYFIYLGIQAFSFIGVVLRSAETGNSLQRCLNVCPPLEAAGFWQRKLKSKKFIYPDSLRGYHGKIQRPACLRLMSKGE